MYVPPKSVINCLKLNNFLLFIYIYKLFSGNCGVLLPTSQAKRNKLVSHDLNNQQLDYNKLKQLFIFIPSLVSIALRYLNNFIKTNYY